MNTCNGQRCAGMGMSKHELTLKVCEAIEALEKSRPGRGPSTERAAYRAKANEIVATLPNNWWRKVSEELWLAFAAAAD
jgi:hypothetical protein